jgi:PAS domain-containing protein
MDRHEWKSFFTWLETASVEELRERHARLETVLEQLRDADIRRDGKRMRRYLEQRLMELLDEP